MYLFFRSSWSVRKAIHCQPRWPSIKNWATVSRKQPTIINFIELFTFMKWLLVTVLSKTKLYKHFVAAILQKKIWAGGFEPEGRYWGLLELGSGFESPCWYFFSNTRHSDLINFLLNETICHFLQLLICEWVQPYKVLGESTHSISNPWSMTKPFYNRFVLGAIQRDTLMMAFCDNSMTYQCFYWLVARVRPSSSID